MGSSEFETWMRRTSGRIASFARRPRASQAPPPDLVVLESSDTALRLTRKVRRTAGAAAGGAPGASADELRSVTRPLAAGLEAAARDAAEREALAAMVAELGVAGFPAVASLEGPDVVVRRFSLPTMKGADLRSAIELECRRLVSYPVGEAVIRHEVLSDARSGRETPVLVAIAPKRRVDERRALLASSGLRPWSVTVRAAGLRADLERTGSLAKDEAVAYLHIGEDSSQIVVLKGRDVRFSRDLSIGRQTMAAALRQIVVPGVGTVERSAEAAETLLRECGVPLETEEAQIVDGVPLAAVGIMLRPTLERLVRELWNSFDYCNEQFLGEAVTGVVLRGPGAALRNLENYLLGVLKLPVRAERTTGAALASVSRDTLNFLGPDRTSLDLARVVEGIPVPAAAVAAAILVVSIALPSEVQTGRVRARVATLRGELATLATQSAAVASFRAARAEEARLQAFESQLTGSRVVWSELLRDVSHRIGPDVRLTSLEVVTPAAAPGAAAPAPDGTPAPPEPRALRISGVLSTRRSPAENVLASLLRSLGASPHLDQVRLEGSQRVAPAVSSFTLTARLAEKGGS